MYLYCLKTPPSLSKWLKKQSIFLRARDRGRRVGKSSRFFFRFSFDISVASRFRFFFYFFFLVRERTLRRSPRDHQACWATRWRRSRGWKRSAGRVRVCGCGAASGDFSPRATQRAAEKWRAGEEVLAFEGGDEEASTKVSKEQKNVPVHACFLDRNATLDCSFARWNNKKIIKKKNGKLQQQYLYRRFFFSRERRGFSRHTML